LNDLGYATGAAERSDGRIHAFLYADGRMIDLGTLGGTSSSGYAINAAGQVVGSSYTVSGRSHAFVWDERGGMRDLGTLGGSDSRAMAINSSGTIAGAATNRGRYFHATVWKPGAGITDIGTLGGAHSYAYGINDAGVVGGWSYDALGRSRAFVWSDGMLFDLNDLVSNAPGWSLTAAYGINRKGQIVGTGLFNGQSAAFLLDPVVYSKAQSIDASAKTIHSPTLDTAAVPEPGGMAVVGLAGLFAWRWKRRSV
jgi:MYXO-CTERM domain-containing protein